MITADGVTSEKAVEGQTDNLLDLRKNYDHTLAEVRRIMKFGDDEGIPYEQRSQHYEKNKDRFHKLVRQLNELLIQIGPNHYTSDHVWEGFH
jgi:hypothetical protein